MNKLTLILFSLLFSFLSSGVGWGQTITKEDLVSRLSTVEMEVFTSMEPIKMTYW